MRTVLITELVTCLWDFPGELIFLSHVTALFSLNMLSRADFLSSTGSEEESCSVTQLCVILCNRMDCSTPVFPVFHYFPEFAQTDVRWVGDAIQPFHPLSPSSHPALNLPQYQDLFQWVSSLHQVAKVLEPQLRHQSEGEIAFYKIYLWQGWPGSGTCSSIMLTKQRDTEAVLHWEEGFDSY